MRDERGFSLLELLIVAVIISVLMVVAIDRLLKLRYEAERVMVQSVVAALRSALYVEFSASTARGQKDRLDSLRGSNPMLRLSEKPDGYAGEFYGPDPAISEPGTWYFDTRDHALVYVLRFPDEFVRHKMLDVLGDLYLAGAPIVGRFEGDQLTPLGGPLR